nr:toxin-antitoxin system HicB family antitoxin [Escherichia coli]
MNAAKTALPPTNTTVGKFTARLTPERHAALVTAGLATGLSLNEMLNEGVDLFLQKYV